MLPAKPPTNKSALAAPSNAALTAAEFGSLLAPLIPDSSPLAIAVSGGADSMALLLLAAKTRPVVALTVDHGLRETSAAEAAQVAQWCASRAIPHHTLRWEAPTMRSLQEAARSARYDLMGRFCRKSGIPALATAHHRGDQAETLFFRLARGSGLSGLACIPPSRPLVPGVQLLRPLLPVPKARLVATLEEMGQEWIEDPSNQNSDFTRIHIRRQLMETDDYDGLCERAYAVTESLTRFRNLLENNLARELTVALSGDDILPEPFLAMAPEYQLQGLALLTRRIGGGEHPPRSEKLERFHAQLRADLQGGKAVKRTFGGCLFNFRPKEKRVAVTREKSLAS